MSKKKVPNMNGVAAPVVGTKEFRDNLSGYLHQVINKKQIIQVGKKVGPQESAILMPVEIIHRLIEQAAFQSKVYYDEQTKQYVAMVDNFIGDGVGDTTEEAVEMALDNIESLVEGFFEDSDWYLRSPKYRALLPHYLRLKFAKSREQMAEILGLR